MLVVGVAVLIAATITWTATHIVRGRVGHLQLSSPDPETRRAAVQLVAERGLAENAAALADLALTETEPGVIDALAHAVARRQWEPTDDPHVLALRSWASEYFSSGRGHLPALGPGPIKLALPADEIADSGPAAIAALIGDVRELRLVGDGFTVTFQRTGHGRLPEGPALAAKLAEQLAHLLRGTASATMEGPGYCLRVERADDITERFRHLREEIAEIVEAHHDGHGSS